MNALLRFSMAVTLALVAVMPVAAQVCCPTSSFVVPGGQTYRIAYQTVYDERQETAYRVE